MMCPEEWDPFDGVQGMQLTALALIGSWDTIVSAVWATCTTLVRLTGYKLRPRHMASSTEYSDADTHCCMACFKFRRPSPYSSASLPKFRLFSNTVLAYSSIFVTFGLVEFLSVRIGIWQYIHSCIRQCCCSGQVHHLRRCERAAPWDSGSKVEHPCPPLALYSGV